MAKHQSGCFCEDVFYMRLTFKSVGFDYLLWHGASSNQLKEFKAWCSLKREFCILSAFGLKLQFPLFAVSPTCWPALQKSSHLSEVSKAFWDWQVFKADFFGVWGWILCYYLDTLLCWSSFTHRSFNVDNAPIGWQFVISPAPWVQISSRATPTHTYIDCLLLPQCHCLGFLRWSSF